jgi:hypothetical protein
MHCCQIKKELGAVRKTVQEKKGGIDFSMFDQKKSSRTFFVFSSIHPRHMIIHCDSCGKAVSNRLEKCPFCLFCVRPKRERYDLHSTSFEDMIPSFRRKIIG